MQHPLRTLCLLALGLTLAACNGQDALPTTAEVESALAQPNGGFAFTAEAPAFGYAKLFASEALAEPAPVVDALAQDPSVVSLSQPGAGNRRFVLLAVWGQPRADADLTTPTTWNGEVRVNRGAVIARRALRFEAPTDALLPRTDAQVLGFTSATLPHHDGLLLNVLDDPTADASLVGEVTLTFAPLASPITIPFDQLGGYHSVRRVDLFNYLLIAAVEIPATACTGGLVLGRWHQLRTDLGFFLGRWVGAGGELHGHLKGVFGQRTTGDRVFFGKYLGAGGEARGLLHGTYADGTFQGEWTGVSGPAGTLQGAYVEARSGAALHGLYIGGWIQTDCTTPDLPAAE
jgi:hypothetical protein